VLRVNRDDQTTSGVGAFEHTEASRRVSNLIRYGVVKEADYENALIRVELQGGELLSDWIPWVTLRASNDKFWWAPEEGEVMMLLSPSGELANAVALPAAFSNQNQNGDRPTVQRQTFEDGTVIEYDREANRYTIDATASSGSVVVKAQTVTVEAQGAVTISGASISLNP
jgi:phage baseplate assembly protein V